MEACRGYLKMMTWRPGEQEWTKVEFHNLDDDNYVTFIVPFHNSVFLDGEFYLLLARDGKLGVFNPKDMTWRVLDKPGAIQDGDDIVDDHVNEVDDNDCEDEEEDAGGSTEDEDSEEEGDEDGANQGEEEDNEEEEQDNEVHFDDRDIILYHDQEYCYLVERNGELLAVFRQEDRAIRVYTLDRCKMEWTKVKDGWDDDLVLFWDRRGAMAVTRHDDTYGRRRVYLPAFAKEDDAVSFYSLQEGRYHPGFYGVKEHMNAIWYQPDFD
jgi:hypothetical protein